MTEREQKKLLAMLSEAVYAMRDEIERRAIEEAKMAARYFVRHELQQLIHEGLRAHLHELIEKEHIHINIKVGHDGEV
jgi:hypothetical protein